MQNATFVGLATSAGCDFEMIAEEVDMYLSARSCIHIRASKHINFCTQVLEVEYHRQ